MDELEQLQASYDELAEWADAAMEVIALGVELMPIDQLSQWTAVRTVQETCPLHDQPAGSTNA